MGKFQIERTAAGQYRTAPQKFIMSRAISQTGPVCYNSRMQTAIEFGKEFLIQFYTKRDAEESLSSLAEDVVWVTPEQVYHFRARAEELAFLQRQMQRDPEPRYVDVESVMADSHAGSVRLVTYQANLVPADPRETVRMRCSLGLLAKGETFEITFLHVSRIYERSGTEQIRDFTNAIPAGVMILTLTEGGVRSLYHSQYFYRALGYGAAKIPENEFKEMLSDDPFFLLDEEGKKAAREAFARAGEKGREFTVTLRLRRAEGTFSVCEMAARPTYRDGGSTVYYCLFRDISDARARHTKLKMTASLFAGIVSHLPVSICVLRLEEKGQKAVYVSDTLPKLLGISTRDYLAGVQEDFFFGLTMTGVTKESLMRRHVAERSRDTACGTYPCARREGRWVSLSMCTVREKAGTLVYLTYTDCTAQRQEAGALRRDNEALRQQSRKWPEHVRAVYEREKEAMQKGESRMAGLFAANLSQDIVEEAGGPALQPLIAAAKDSSYESFLAALAGGASRRQTLPSDGVSAEAVEAERSQSMAAGEALTEAVEAKCPQSVLAGEAAAETAAGGQGASASAAALAALWARPVLLEAAERDEEIAPVVVELTAPDGGVLIVHARMVLTCAEGGQEFCACAYLEDVTREELLRRIESASARADCDYIACLDLAADRYTVLYAPERNADEQKTVQESGDETTSRAQDGRLAGQPEGRTGRSAAGQRTQGADAAPAVVCVPPPTGSYTETFLEFYRAYGAQEESGALLQLLQPAQLKQALAGQESCECAIGLRAGRGLRAQGLRITALDRARRLYGVLAYDCTKERALQNKETLSYRNYYLEAAQENRIKTDFLCRLRREMEEPLRRIAELAQGAESTQIAALARGLLRYVGDIPAQPETDVLWKSLREQIFSYPQMMDGVCGYVKERCREKGVRFSLRPQGRPPERVIGDRLKLEQALLHLLDNAVKYTAPGGQVTFTVQVKPAGDDRVYLRFVVKDTGSGIDERRLPTIFDPFPGGELREAAPAGPGLGLSVAKDIVRRMGGSIQVRSEKDAGTTFTVGVTLRVGRETESE